MNEFSKGLCMYDDYRSCIIVGGFFPLTDGFCYVRINRDLIWTWKLLG
jgi:hypothetical protein